MRERERAERAERERERERERGLVRVRDSRDLRPVVNPHPPGRRPDPSGNGTYLSPLKCLTSHLSQTYNICNPSFNYESAHNPRRVLTKPSKPVHNEGYDNEDNDYILYVNDFLGGEESSNGRYLILDVLGQGTFGQVVKCQNIKTHEIVAVKVVKNKPAYFNQSMMEVTILELLNKQWDPNDEHHILRLRDTFIHKKHLCLVFELLSSNLYELIKQNQFGGLSTQLVKVFTAQLLDALSVLKDARLIHCDLKPENILLKSLQSPQIKVIDFGSACHERQTVYTYIQSRFYRSPEVLLGMSYTASIDMWSLGCIVVELFLGLPLFPGTSEFNQMTRIVEMLGMPPAYMLEIGKSSNDFFKSSLDEYGRKKWRIKALDEYCRDKKTTEQPGKKYFSATTLPEIIKTAPNTNKTNKAVDMEKEANLRLALIDFVQGLLNLDPVQRWSPQQALGHPFITGEKFTKPYPVDVSSRKSSAQISPQPTSASNAKRPYGGLIPSQPSGTRAYQDAAAYNQHLNQHQQYTAQAATAAQQQSAYRNPYAQPMDDANADYVAQQQRHAHAAAQAHAVQQAQVQAQAQAQAAYVASQPHQGAVNSNYLPVSSTTGSIPTNPPTVYYGNRARANTINQMDIVPPQLAKFAHLAPGVMESGLGRNSLTPVLNRDDAMREWERRHGVGAQAGANTKRTSQQNQFAHTLDYLAEQAELQSQNMTRWGQGTSYHPRQASNYQTPTSPQTAYQGGTYHTPSKMQQSTSNSEAWDYEAANWRGHQAPHVQITSPPQAYATSTTNTGRYNAVPPPTSYPNPPQVSYDQFDVRDGMGTLYAPMQPQQYQQPASSGQADHRAPQNLSFYGSGIVASGAMPNTPTRSQYADATNPTVPQSTHTHQSSKDSTRRMSGIDATQQWRG
ncbi:kinase-like protein [Dacryopinax primogenitus]|uniref:Kinase-like protein n=1 Tax=Dacryopinax primogenitus (strain DJM 731) TaxID=1858805 RepID=M5GCT5_DACPD|nr:kinase-like protein [Dacryopinax primogenitus]EJU04052.1 kinase-like protein [Dacryopinax primogenitus]